MKKNKYNIGDWLVHDLSDGRISPPRQIVDMTDKSYILDGEDFNTFYFKDLEDSFRLWTIQDARDGDVLEQNNEVFIYSRRKLMYSIAIAHCFVDSAGGFYFDGEFSYYSISPATKEKRQLLFDKIAEAGYEWDADEKRLKKIESKELSAQEPTENIDWQALRHQYAGMAMLGILSSPIVEGIDPNPSQEQVAKWAVMQADKLIEELKKIENE